VKVRCCTVTGVCCVGCAVLGVRGGRGACPVRCGRGDWASGCAWRRVLDDGLLISAAIVGGSIQLVRPWEALRKSVIYRQIYIGTSWQAS
jgi:hypothetical protein